MLFRYLVVLLAGLFCARASADVLLDFEDGQVPAGWVQGANSQASWVNTSSAAFTGARSLRSGVIGHSQRAVIEWTDTFADSTLSFMLRYDTENCCDYFRLYIDNTVMETRNGSGLSWIEVRETLGAGVHTIRFEYSKDGSAVGGQDAIWIDNVRIGAALPVAQPLMQVPGAAIVSHGTRLAEYRPDGGAALQQEMASPGGLTMTPGGTLYLYAGSSGGRLSRYVPSTNVRQTVADDVMVNSGFASLDDRLIAGTSNCGYVTVAYATGSVFRSTPPPNCNNSWTAADRRGDALWVLRYGSIARRSAAVPDAELSSFVFTAYAYDIAAAPDGTLWVAEGSALSNLAADGTLLGRYPLDESFSRIAVREDGLLVGASYNRVHFLR